MYYSLIGRFFFLLVFTLYNQWYLWSSEHIQECVCVCMCVCVCVDTENRVVGTRGDGEGVGEIGKGD